jgi:hypothetical protein
MAAALTEALLDETTIKTKANLTIQAADQAHELVLKEGIPFTEAYRSIGENFRTR